MYMSNRVIFLNIFYLFRSRIYSIHLYFSLSPNFSALLNLFLSQRADLIAGDIALRVMSLSFVFLNTAAFCTWRILAHIKTRDLLDFSRICRRHSDKWLLPWARFSKTLHHLIFGLWAERRNSANFSVEGERFPRRLYNVKKEK